MKFVCFGGGNAMPKVVLSELKNYGVDIVSVTSMVDNGGSTGALRRELDVLPPGDIRRHILALSEAEEWKKKLWKFRFANYLVFEGGHKGHSFANILIAGLEKTADSYGDVLLFLHDFMKVRGKCLPATSDKTMLYAELENGQIIEGEDEIDVPKRHDGNLKIKRIFVNPQSKGYPAVMEEIRDADVILIGPGDLYSSILPNFLHNGIADAIKKSKAKKIFICPAMTKFGETNGFTVEDFANEVEKYIGSELTYILYNNTIPSEGRIRSYMKEEPLVREIVPFSSKDLPEKFVGTDLLKESGGIEYDSLKVVKKILDLVYGDKVKGIIFDADHTLYEHNKERAYTAMLNYIEKETGIPKKKLIPVWIKNYNAHKQHKDLNARRIENVLSDTLQEFLDVVPEEAVSKGTQIFWDNLLNSLEFHYNLSEVVEKLKKDGYKLAISSDEYRNILEMKLRRAIPNWKKYFDVVITSDDVGSMKPSRKFFDLAIEKLGLKPEEVLVVGDSYERDLNPAVQECGSRGFLVRNLSDIEKIPYVVGYNKEVI